VEYLLQNISLYVQKKECVQCPVPLCGNDIAEHGYYFITDSNCFGRNFIATNFNL
jgi:hypothetical protein